MIKIKGFQMKTLFILGGIMLLVNSCFVFDRLDNTNIGVKVYTTSLHTVTSSTAICEGEIRDTTVSIKSRGFCWSSSSFSPSINDENVKCAPGIGKFTGQLTGLTPFTFYYVRSFAEDNNGISYGESIRFQTVAIGQIATIAPADDERGETWAVCGGNITSDSLSPITARGVCWSTRLNPTTADSKTIDGTGIGIYTSKITGLAIATSYNVRAYATNAKGTMYGKNVNFMTYTKPADCVDWEERHYKTLQIGSQIWTVENIATKYTARHSTIPIIGSDWSALTTSASDNSGSGLFYNWVAATKLTEIGRIPKGWRVPTDNDWQILENFMIKNKLNLSATGFNPVRIGDRAENGSRVGENTNAGWWSMSAADTLSVASCRYIQNDTTVFYKMKVPKNRGLSVRFVRIN
jgi:uncharacterized protein (TIGR02145 family)